MSKIKQITFLFILLLSIIYPEFSYALDEAANNTTGQLPVEIDADSIEFDQETSIYIAEGNVVARQSGVTLMADRIVIDMEKGILKAKGNLSGFDEGGNLLTGDSLELDLDLKSAIFLNGTLFFKKNNIYIRSAVIKKTGPQTYEAGYTTYTSCDCDYEAGETPAWSISSRSSSVTIGEYFAGWHSVFRVKRVPIFYLPYMKIPIKKERQTGFLLPTPGYSDVRGVSLRNYFYWVIAPTSDATLSYVHDVKRGNGLGLEFRHYSRHRSYSELNFNYYREYDIDRVRTFRENVANLSRPLSADADRWELRFTHEQSLPFSLRLRADVNVVSDDEYLLDFELDKDRRSLASLESTVSVTKTWDLYNMVLEFRRFDNLLNKLDEDVLQKLPELTFTALPRKVYSTPFYISLNSSVVNYYRVTGDHGQRVDFAPKFSLPLRPGKYFELTPSFTPRYTRYRVIGSLGTSTPERFLYEFRADAVTTLIKNLGTAKPGINPIRHTIRPRISYLYIPKVDQQGIPDYDLIDAITTTNKIEYSLNTTLTRAYKEGKIIGRDEYLYFKISQFYDINEGQRALTGPLDEREPFGDIMTELRLRPNKSVSLVVDSDYDLYDKVFNRYDATIKLADNRGDDFYLAYRYDRSLSTLYMEGGIGIYINKTLNLKFKERYSFDEERSLESRVDAEFKRQCWSAILTYQKTPEEERIFLNFTLKSLGDLVEFSESM